MNIEENSLSNSFCNLLYGGGPDLDGDVEVYLDAFFDPRRGMGVEDCCNLFYVLYLLWVRSGVPTFWGVGRGSGHRILSSVPSYYPADIPGVWGGDIFIIESVDRRTALFGGVYSIGVVGRRKVIDGRSTADYVMFVGMGARFASVRLIRGEDDRMDDPYCIETLPFDQTFRMVIKYVFAASHLIDAGVLRYDSQPGIPDLRRVPVEYVGRINCLYVV